MCVLTCTLFITGLNIISLGNCLNQGMSSQIFSLPIHSLHLILTQFLEYAPYSRYMHLRRKTPVATRNKIFHTCNKIKIWLIWRIIYSMCFVRFLSAQNFNFSYLNCKNGSPYPEVMSVTCSCRKDNGRYIHHYCIM